MANSEQTSPYLMKEPPTSAGKALLSRCLVHWCVLHHGLTADEIAAAFDQGAGLESSVRRNVSDAARLIGELIAGGRLRTYVRPIGGGTPSPLAKDAWELDDFRPRLSRSALDPKRPFDASAEPTHWIFVELEDFNEVVEASCADVLLVRDKPAIRQPAPMAVLLNDDPVRAHRRSDNRLIRLPEIVHRTGMSASTVYRRIAQGRFPKQVPMEAGNIASWLDSEIHEWIANPR